MEATKTLDVDAKLRQYDDLPQRTPMRRRRKGTVSSSGILYFEESH